MPANTILLLAVELFVYFVVLTGLFRLRHSFGMGIFIAALGTMHFLETYLAAIFYIRFVFDTQISPGSTILFAGKLIMLLLVYIREDAATVRQPIYGILVGNFLTVGLVLILREHALLTSGGRSPDFAFMDEMGGLMVWGTLLLFVDSILIILLYEKLARWLHGQLVVRIILSAAVVLTFDQLGFYPALYLFLGLPPQILLGGWIAKMGAAIGYGLLTGIYLRTMERQRPEGREKKLWDVFEVLTYRERYHALLQTSGRDALTAVFDRSRFETEGRLFVNGALDAGEPVSLMLVDLDHFKRINDSLGHALGDAALRAVADALKLHLRSTDCIFRYGGDEFVVCCRGLRATSAVALAERLREEVGKLSLPGLQGPLTISIGLASGPIDGENVEDLFAAADSRLYLGKKRGRNRVIASVGGEIEIIPIAAN